MEASTISTSAAVSAYSTYSKTSTNKTKDAETSTSIFDEEEVVYEKSDETASSSATYSINTMSATDRAALIEQMKADQAQAQQNLVDLAQKMISQQSSTWAYANSDDDSIWSAFAGGKTLTEAAKAKAQEDISDDGYYGATQTAQRIFDFACALAGDDEELMKKMQEAVAKGFELAEKAWGSTLPDVSYQTLDKVNSLFEDYFNSKASS